MNFKNKRTLDCNLFNTHTLHIVIFKLFKKIKKFNGRFFCYTFYVNDFKSKVSKVPVYLFKKKKN